MALPVRVSLDKIGGGSLDLTPLIAQNSLTWSSVVPGGFASCSFTMSGDFRSLVKLVPFLSTVRIVGDSGRVLFEGSVEDLAPTISETSVGLKVGVFGLQNILKETSVRQIWSMRQIGWQPRSLLQVAPDPAFNLTIGQFDPSDLTKAGVLIAGNGQTSSTATSTDAYFQAPAGLTLVRIMGTRQKTSSVAANLQQRIWSSTDSGATWSSTLLNDTTNTTTTFNLALGANANAVLLQAASTANYATAVNVDFGSFYDLRLLGTTATEDASGGFYGGTLIRNLLALASLGEGVIESGSDFTIDHLDASVRRSAYDILQEITQYYAREWAVWEDGLLHWRTPQLSQPQWVIPIGQLSALDLDASVQNSQKTSIVLYTEAATGRTAESSVSSTDRRNPYVVTGRQKDELVSAGFPMTANTAPQLASIVLNDLGFGPVPAAGTISLSGETVVQHAQGNAAKAWELRAGDNVTIPELPLADVFTQDGRGECLFHIVSAEANIATGDVTLSLDSYGSKRSDVLLARLAAVTQALGG